MNLPLEIRFLGMDPSEAVEAAARDKASRLEQCCGELMSCRVTVESRHKHQHQGHPLAVRIDATLPGHTLSVDRVQHEDVYVALREGFDDMRRRIEDTVRRMRGDEKRHPVPLHGEVARFDAEGRFGYIRTPDGTEYWFGPDNLAGQPFEHLTLGTAVQFIPELAAEGPQAKRVSVGKHRVG